MLYYAVLYAQSMLLKDATALLNGWIALWMK